MSKHTVKGFTLLEITLTMMISAILIGLTFTIYTIVSRSFSLFTRKNDEVMVMLTLDKLLKRDFLTAETIRRKDSQVFFIGRQDTAVYDFKEHFITRTKGIRDTFRVTCQDLNSKFDHTESGLAGDSSVLQDELFFRIKYIDQTIPYHYLKHYSSETLLNNPPPHAIR
jgi:prepilin-type N-terminal cleavage/methylation domain-containing protein